MWFFIKPTRFWRCVSVCLPLHLIYRTSVVIEVWVWTPRSLHFFFFSHRLLPAHSPVSFTGFSLVFGGVWHLLHSATSYYVAAWRLISNSAGFITIILRLAAFEPLCSGPVQVQVFLHPSNSLELSLDPVVLGMFMDAAVDPHVNIAKIWVESWDLKIRTLVGLESRP